MLCYIELYEAQHPPVQMDKTIKCELKFCDQYCLCYVTLNCMTRNTRQFRWIKTLSAILNFVISTECYVTSNCVRCDIRQFRWIKILSAILNFVIGTVYVMLH